MHTEITNPGAQTAGSTSPAERMRAVVQDRYGSADALRITDFDRP